MHVTDVAEVICHVITKEIFSKDIEVVGPQVLSFGEIIKKIISSINKKRILLPMPLFLAKISASFLQVLPNPLITRDQLNLLRYDNVKSENGITNFDIGCPSKILFDEGIKKYAYNWRQGGEFSIEKNN